MPDDLMRYDLLAQDALRGVVRAALTQVARTGLPGEHHLFIAFDTRHPEVHISERLREKYPEEITIVLQHQYWNLEVRETGFSVELSFDKVLEKLVVPFAAVKTFFDPAVQFGLQFEAKPLAEAAAVSADVPQTETAPASGEAKDPAEGDARKVVSLDHFRKK
jgi:uncharacterized protein